MRSKPKRSRPMRGKWPRYISGRPSTGPRQQESKLSIRRALARAARPPETLAGCLGSRHRHSSNGNRAHGAGCAGASLDHDPSACGRLGRSARRAAERPRGTGHEPEKRPVAGRPQPPRTTARTDPPSHRLVVLKDAQYRHGRAHKADLHPKSPPSRVVTPALCAGTGRSEVTARSSIVR
jgi:hypothetical protein